MPAFPCHDCAELHAQHIKRYGYAGYGTCGCICPRCDNDGKLICETCGAKGKTGLLGRKCKTCDGNRTLDCPVCKGFLADPACMVCRGTSCQTCWGSRTVELEQVLARLNISPRRVVFYPPGSLGSAFERDFPAFTFEAAWKRLADLIDPEPVVTVCRGVEREHVEVTGRLAGSERSTYAVYRLGDNQYGIEECFASFESGGTTPLAP